MSRSGARGAVPAKLLLLALAALTLPSPPAALGQTGSAQDSVPPAEAARETPATAMSIPVDPPGQPGPSDADPLPGDDPGELFVKANGAYEAGRYDAAAELYARLIELGIEDGRLYYNLGNAYLRSGDLGRSVAAYLRGRVLRPRDEDLQANLAFARQSTKDAISAPEPPPLLATLFFWHYASSPREVAAATVLLNILFWSVWLIRLFRRDSETLRWLFMLLLVLLIATAGSLLARRTLPRTVAVVVPQKVEARTAPDAASVVRFELHAGTELLVKDRRTEWLRIALSDGQQGWIPRDSALVVDG